MVEENKDLRIVGADARESAVVMVGGDTKFRWPAGQSHNRASVLRVNIASPFDRRNKEIVIRRNMHRLVAELTANRGRRAASSRPRFRHSGRDGGSIGVKGHGA